MVRSLGLDQPMDSVYGNKATIQKKKKKKVKMHPSHTLRPLNLNTIATKNDGYHETVMQSGTWGSSRTGVSRGNWPIIVPCDCVVL